MHIHIKLWDIISHACPNFKGSLPEPKLQLKLWHGWLITPNSEPWDLITYPWIVNYTNKDLCDLITHPYIPLCQINPISKSCPRWLIYQSRSTSKERVDQDVLVAHFRVHWPSVTNWTRLTHSGLGKPCCFSVFIVIQGNPCRHI